MLSKQQPAPKFRGVRHTRSHAARLSTHLAVHRDITDQPRDITARPRDITTARKISG